jgi:flagellar assembly protein FliH
VGSRPPNAYARFIPREELSDFEAWTPDVFNEILSAAARGGVYSAVPMANAPPPPPPPAEPEAQAVAETSAEEWAQRVLAARQQGYQDGYRDGLEALDAAKRQFARQVSGQMAAVVSAFDEQIAAHESRMAQALLDSAVTLARQVVRSELQQRPDCVTQVAREAVGALMASARQLRLRLHPDDAALVEQGAAETLRARDILIQADARIAPGGCIVDSDLGQVDARIATRWAHAAAVFNVPLAWNDADPVADLPAAGGDDAGPESAR